MNRNVKLINRDLQLINRNLQLIENIILKVPYDLILLSPLHIKLDLMNNLINVLSCVHI